MDFFVAAGIAACFVAVFFAGSAYGKFQMVKEMLEQMTDKEIADLQNLMELDATNIAFDHPILRQEVVNGLVYLYDDTGYFVCQGETASEAASRYGAINSGVAVVSCTHGSSYRIVAGKIESSE